MFLFAMYFSSLHGQTQNCNRARTVYSFFFCSESRAPTLATIWLLPENQQASRLKLAVDPQCMHA